MSFSPSFPPLFPRLEYRIPVSALEQSSSQPSSTSLFSPARIQNLSQNGRGSSQDDYKILSDIDREEIRLQARNMSIAIHGQTFLRPPGFEPYVAPGSYADQEQAGTPAQLDETFIQDEDEEGFVMSEDDDDDEEEEEEVDEYEDEELEDEEEEQDLDADIEPPSDASYLTASMTTPPTAAAVHGTAFGIAASPTTPSAIPTHHIEALSGLADALRQTRDEALAFRLRDAIMDMEEGEGNEEDLDAEIEDMDDEELESSIIEGDSMEL